MHRLTLLALLVSVSCATPVQTGVMAGHWTPKGGEPQIVPMGWESLGLTHGAIHATLGPGGEHFNGSYVRVEATGPHVTVSKVYTQWYGPAFASLNWGPDGNYPPGGVDFNVFVHMFSGKVVATLFGDKGSTIRCQFTLENARKGLVTGGSGSCQVSDGSEIEVHF